MPYGKSNGTGNGIRVARQSLYRPAPFTDELDAEIERDRVDYSLKMSLELAKSGKASRPVRVYADGIYDVFHQGHSRQLMQAKNLFPNVYLIVGVCSDELTHSRKGCTVMNDSERYEAVRHCRYVDEVLRNAPWETDMEFLTQNKIDFVAHDEEPYTTGTGDDVYAYLKEAGMFVATERTEGISTSDIVARIVKDYDMYVRRNLARGYSAKDLNVGFIKENKFKLQNKMDSLRETGKRVLDNLDEKRSDMVHRWEDKSREFIHNFLLLFGKERMSQIWNESRGKILKALSPPASPSHLSHSHYSSSSSEDEEEEEEFNVKKRRNNEEEFRNKMRRRTNEEELRDKKRRSNEEYFEEEEEDLGRKKRKNEEYFEEEEEEEELERKKRRKNESFKEEEESSSSNGVRRRSELKKLNSTGRAKESSVPVPEITVSKSRRQQ